MLKESVRVRFGIKLPIFANWLIFVAYMPPDTYSTLKSAFIAIGGIAELYGGAELAHRLVCEVATP